MAWGTCAIPHPRGEGLGTRTNHQRFRLPGTLRKLKTYSQPAIDSQRFLGPFNKSHCSMNPPEHPNLMLLLLPSFMRWQFSHFLWPFIGFSWPMRARSCHFAFLYWLRLYWLLPFGFIGFIGFVWRLWSHVTILQSVQPVLQISAHELGKSQKQQVEQLPG